MINKNECLKVMERIAKAKQGNACGILCYLKTLILKAKIYAKNRKKRI